MRKVGITLTTAVALLLAGAMTAFACTNLATLNLSESNGAAGATIDVTGSSFANPEGGGQEVAIHWDSVEGAELATAEPDASGAISTTVEVPADAEPGYHVLVATQMQEGDDGELSEAYGTPARASFLVGETPSDQETAPAAASTGGAAPAAETPTGLIALTILLAAAGIGLFGAGLGLFVREVRQRGAVPAPARKE